MRDCCNIKLSELLIILGMFAVLCYGLSNINFAYIKKHDETKIENTPNATFKTNIEITSNNKTFCAEKTKNPCSQPDANGSDEIVELTRQIANNKKDYFDAATSYLSLMISIVTGFFTILGVGVAVVIWFGFKDIDHKIERTVIDKQGELINKLSTSNIDHAKRDIDKEVTEMLERKLTIKNPSRNERNAFE